MRERKEEMAEKEDAEKILRFREQKENLLSTKEEMQIGETCHPYNRKSKRADLEELEELAPAKRRKHVACMESGQETLRTEEQDGKGKDQVCRLDG